LASAYISRAKCEGGENERLFSFAFIRVLHATQISFKPSSYPQKPKNSNQQTAFRVIFGNLW